MLLFLVMIHELWHYRAARKAKVKVLEFGIGIPPKAKTIIIDKHDTHWTLNRIPLGWFVRLKWEDPTGSDFYDADSFTTTTFWYKLLILMWWIIMNTIFARWALIIAFMVGIKPIQVIPDSVWPYDIQSRLFPTYSTLNIPPEPVVVAQVFSWRASWLIQTGDMLTRVWTSSVNSQNFTSEMKKYIWSTVNIQIKRWDNNISWNIVCWDQECLLGIWLSWSDIDVPFMRYSFVDAITVWSYELVAQTRLTFASLGTLWSKLFSFDRQKTKQWVSWLSGPAWVVRLSQNIRDRWGRAQFLAFAALISLNLAIFNVLPIPGLDWWRIVGVMIQKLLWAPWEKYFMIEWRLNTIFLVLLMWLGIIVLLKDLWFGW